MCEAGPLTPDRDAGARAVADLIEAARELGATVAFFDESDGPAGDLVSRLRSFEPTVIVVSRPGLFMRLHPQLGDFAVPVVYFAHDVHHVRLGLQRQFDSGLGERSVRVMKVVEEYCFRQADLTVFPTPDEATVVRETYPDAAVTWIRYFAMPVFAEHPLHARSLAAEPNPQEQRLVFVGSSAHAPNRDGVAWFIETIWPSLRTREEYVRLDVCGAWDPAAAAGLLRDGITFHGPVSEGELSRLMNAASLGIAPLRFGAGMKRKTLDYLSRGLPVISTDFGVEGLALDGDGSGAREPIPGVLLCQTPEEWLKEITTVLGDKSRWKQLSIDGQVFVQKNFSPELYKVDLVRIVTEFALGIRV